MAASMRKTREPFTTTVAPSADAALELARELESKSRLLEATIAHMDQGLLVLDRDFCLKLWNRRYEELTGLPPGFLEVGMPIREVLSFLAHRGAFGPGDPEARLQERLDSARNVEARVEIRMHLLGTTLRLDRHALPEGGSVTTFTDITAAQCQEEELRASQARFAALANMSSDWIWEQDAELRCTFISPTKDTVFALASRLDLGKRADELDLVIDDEGAWRAYLDDLARRRPFRDVRLKVRDVFGQIRHIVLSGDPIFAPNAAFLGYRGTGSDVTAEAEALARAKSAESAAEHAHGRLMTAIEATTQGFALFDAEDRLVAGNRHYLNRLLVDPTDDGRGWTLEQIIDALYAAGWRGIIPGTDRPASPEEWKTWRLRLHRDPPPRPVVYQGSDGTWNIISERRTADGGTVSIRVDVTELKRSEEELRLARDAAEATGRAKNEFLASMSHELRTPLNAIIGFAEIMKGELFGPLGTPRYRTYAHDILTSATYLMDLIRDVLDTAKIEAGRKEIVSVPIELKPEIDGCLEMMRDSIGSAGLFLQEKLPPELPRVRGDARSLRQVLLNLLSNAAKFTPAGGRVTLAAASDERCVRLSVTDTGIGIPAEVLPRLGRPFEQVGSVLHRKRPGSGLGLALSRSLAELMGGSLSIESVEGEGTTVTLTLPRAD
jgi:signal transduction histidine kinase